MFVFKKFTRETISIIMLFIYLFSSFSILSSHNHNEDHHNQDLPICETHNVDYLNIFDCSHQSHVISFEESCTTCDHFANLKPAILDISTSTFSESFILRKIKLFSSLDLIYLANNQNKSPPFVV